MDVKLVPSTYQTGGGPLQPLGVVDERREDDESDDQEEHEQAQLVGARTERLHEDLESTSAHLPPLYTCVTYKLCVLMHQVHIYRQQSVVSF